jgi:acetyl-CoA carboxylase biotin carboxyl carrier protein
MDVREIKELVAIIRENDLVEFEMESGDFALRIRRGCVVPVASPVAAPAAVAVAPSGDSKPAATTAGQGVSSEQGWDVVKSPMVGTFYRSPSPESKPFVSEGDKVKPDTVVAIIEAMKVMNEIQSEVSGTIVEVLVSDGEPVEFGKPLFKVKRN